jgi:uncharacterized protein (DUF2236 family)
LYPGAPSARIGDHGWVIAHRINGERLVLLGWARAILLQAAHPLVAAGIAEHSRFQASGRVAVARLRSTVRAMLTLAFGDEAAQSGTIHAIRHVHRRIHGELRAPTGVFAAGTRYSAEDPALVLWVHATLIESTLIVYERLLGALAEADRDAYCEQAAGVAVELGAAAADVPRTWPALQRYFDAEYASGRIVVGRDARAIADALLFPPMTAVPEPFAWANRVVTIGLLPAPVRQQYGYGWDERRDRQLDRLLAVLSRMRRMSPAAVAWWPAARRHAAGRATS